MSVSQSDVNHMQAKVNEQKRIRDHLLSELGVIENGVNRASKRLNDLQNHIYSTLVSAENDVVQSQQNLVNAYKTQGEIDRLYESFKAMELANKKIRACNDKKYYEFNNYRTVRKIIQGYLDNFDMKLVQSKTIYKAIEIQHLKSPDYWLTFVLLSIMAWHENDRELAETCIQKAIECDKKNSSVFYMLFNLLVNRVNTAMNWFLLFQECNLTGSDQKLFIMLFSMVSKEIMNDVDEVVCNDIMEFIDKVIEYSKKSESYNEDELINWIKIRYTAQTPRENPDYPLLHRYCKEYNQLVQNLMCAKNNINILQIIKDIHYVSEENMNHYITDCITDIVEEPNEEEKIVYDEIAYNELIITYNGDIKRARADFKDKQIHDTTELNLVKEMVHWVYSVNGEVCDQMKRNMFQITKPLHKVAADRAVTEYRSRFKTTQAIKINDYESSVDFLNADAEQVEIRNYYEGIRDKEIASINNTSAYLSFGAAALCVAGMIWLKLPFMLVIALLCVTAGAGIMYGNKNKIAQLHSEYEKKIQNTIEILHQIVLEFRYYLGEFKKYDDYYDLITKEIESV